VEPFRRQGVILWGRAFVLELRFSGYWIAIDAITSLNPSTS